MAKKTIGRGQITIVDLNDGPGYSPNLLKGTQTGPPSWGSDYPEAHTVTTALNAEGFREMTQTRTTTGAQVSCWKFVESMIDGGVLPFRLFRDGQRYTLSFDYKSTAPVNVYLDMRQNYLGKVFIAPQTQFPASAEWRRASISQVLEMPELNLLKGENTTAWRTVTVSKAGYGLAAPMTPLANLGLKPGDTVSIGMDVRTSSGRILRARLRYRHGGNYDNVMGITTVQNGTKRLEVTGTLPSDCTEVGVALDGSRTSPVSGTETQEEVRAVCLRKGTSGSPAANPEDLRFLLLGATLANPCAAGATASFRKFCVVEGGSESWVPALSEMQGAKGDKGDDGEQGYGIVASVTRDGKTPEWWDTYAATGHTETWTSTSDIRNGCRVGDLFQVVGTDTAGDAHAATYRSTTASGNLVGTCIGHTVTKAGLGVAGVDEHFALSNSATPPAKTASGWQTNPATTPVPTATNRWLWNYETIRHTDGSVTETPVHTACVYGEDGNGILSVTDFYLATAINKEPNSADTGWKTKISDTSFSPTTRFLWNKERTLYTQKGATERIHLLTVWGERGPAGDWTSYVFMTSGTQPATPTDTQNTIPTGWVDAPTSSGRWWMSKATINGVTGKPGTWSTPVQCTGEDGKDGPYTDFKYRVHADLSSPAVDRSMRNPTGWEDEPPTRPSGYNLWMITAEIDADDNIIGQWSLPTKINGEKGEDAVSVALVPETLTFKKGSASRQFATFEVYKGATKLTGWSYSMLPSSTLAPYGIRWSQYTDGYMLIYDGTAKDFALDIPVTVTVEGKTYARTLALRSIADGEKGDPGLAGPIQRVTEWAPGVDYRCDTEPGEDGRMFLDIVTVSRSVSEFDAFVCKEPHTSSADNKPGLDPENPGGDYWTAMSDTGPIYTPFLLAPNANIKFAQSQQILITDEQDNVKAGLAGRESPIWTGAELPANGNFEITKDGKGRWGLADGSRIEIDPDNSRILIYGNKPADGVAPLRTIIQGTAIAANQRIPTGGASTYANTINYNWASHGANENSLLSGGSRTASAQGIATVKIPTITASVSMNKYTPPASGTTTLAPKASATAVVQVLIDSQIVDTFSVNAQVTAIDATESSVSKSNALQSQTKQYSVTEGQTIDLVIKSTNHIPKNSSGTAIGTATISASSVVNALKISYIDIKCIYATNGIHLSRDSDNFFYAIFDSAGRLYVGCKANGKVVFKSDNEPI